jgi:signal transduction histidine kinase
MANVQVTSSCDPPDLTVVGDEAQLEQALVALCVNAAEAMPDGGTLRVAARRAGGGEVLLEVADSGTGIAAQDLPHVFEPFFTTKPRGVGVGLGLAIVYGIVQRHGGSIDVQSEPGRGTTFILRFPPPDAGPSRAPGARPENETRTS